jgi:hypothetical protein
MVAAAVSMRVAATAVRASAAMRSAPAVRAAAEPSGAEPAAGSAATARPRHYGSRRKHRRMPRGARRPRECGMARPNRPARKCCMT